MIEPNHSGNLIIGFLGELPLYTERSLIIWNRFKEPVDRGSFVPGYGTWLVVPSNLTATHSPETKSFKASNTIAFPWRSSFLSQMAKCLHCQELVASAKSLTQEFVFKTIKSNGGEEGQILSYLKKRVSLAN